MTESDFIEKFRKHIQRRRKANGEPYGPIYIKDKVSRLKRLLKVLDLNELTTMDEDCYIKLTETLSKKFPLVTMTKTGKRYTQANDYLVTLRCVYEMENKKKAPRYVLYAGEFVAKYKK